MRCQFRGVLLVIYLFVFLLQMNAQGKRCLFVSSVGTTGTSSEAGIIAKLQEWGYVLTIVNTSTLPTVNFSSYDFCYASESVNSSNLTPLKGHPLPLVVTEAWASKPGVLNWSNPASASNVVPGPVVIVDSTNHPLAAGFSQGSLVTLVASQSTVGLITTVPTITIIPIAVLQSNPSKSVVYGIEKGTTLTDGSIAMNRAVCIGIHESGFSNITEDGFRILKAAIEWATTPPPAITVEPTELSFGGTAIATMSKELSYQLTGSFLFPTVGTITVTAPRNFLLSVEREGTYTSSLTLPYTNGELSTVLYVQFAPTETVEYRGEILHSGGGAEQKVVTVSGVGVATAAPVLYASQSLLQFSALLSGSVSTAQRVTISGSYLEPQEGSIVITAPDGFEVSASQSAGFARTLTVSYENGTIPNRVVYVRFAPTAVGNYNGIITIEGGGAPVCTLRVSGSGVSNEPPQFVADGFGRNATGGAGGTEVYVSNATDFKKYATATGKYIVTVTASMSVGSIEVTSDKTLQGINGGITLTGCLRVNRATNVIIRNLKITNPSGVGSGDGIEITESSNVIVSHCTFVDCADGMLDVVRASDNVTISWCRFRYENQTTHRNTCLFGNSDDATEDMNKLHITVHHCWFDQNCEERLPSVRYGTVHVYNSYYSSTRAMYGVRARLYSQCLVENNFFENCQNPWELLTTTGAPNGKLCARGNNIGFLDTAYGNRWVAGWYTYSNGTTVLIPGTDSVFTPPYPYTLESPEVAKARVEMYAGNTLTLTSVEESSSVLYSTPSEYVLFQNYPNPFNPTTNIQYKVPELSYVTLTVHDVLGREIRKLIDGIHDAGLYSVMFDGTHYPSGTYLFRITVRSFSGKVATKAMKMLLVK